MSRIANHSSYSQLTVLRTIPTGHRSPRNIVIWRNRIFASDYYQSLPQGKRSRFTAFINAMLPYHQPQKRYIQITREYIASIVGCSLKTVSRYFKELMEHGFLTRVAPGRSKEVSRLGINEAPVYAPCAPESDLEKSAPVPVELVDPRIFVHPSVKESKELNPFNARVENSATQQKKEAGDSSKKSKIQPLGIFEPVIASEGTKKAQRALELRAAAALRERVLALRKLSLLKIAYLCRSYFKAGWCVKDILIALESSPDGRLYSTNGADGMRSKVAWLVIRLRSWTDQGGQILPSYCRQKEDARLEELATRAKERAVEIATEKKAGPMPSAVRRKLDFLKVKSALGEEKALERFPEFAT